MRQSMIRLIEGSLNSAIPRSIKSDRFIKGLYYRLFLRRLPDEKRMILLHTQYKSGTHYFRFFLANYLLVHFENAKAPITFDELEKAFPNDTDDFREGGRPYRPPHPVMRRTPYVDFVFGHDQRSVEFSPARIVILYRNPLDFLVSNYFYRYVNRKSVAVKPASPEETLEREFPYLVKTYTLHRRLALRHNVLLIAYEEMARTPQTTFAIILRWLALPVNMDDVRTAIEFSSFDRLRSYEQEHGHIVASDNFEGYFTRSGKIGEWKEHFTEAGAEKVKAALEKAGVSPNQFIYE